MNFFSYKHILRGFIVLAAVLLLSACDAVPTALNDSLSGLRETLALISGATVFPLETTTQRPCEMLHHDSDLFDGEAMPLPPVQDNTIGGEGVFLFDDAPAFGDVSEKHAA
ncbi:MAG: hypothetical protein L3J02_07660 [Henriciella sp.]|nr:hypothetical protein [Henriciella sp.]